MPGFEYLSHADAQPAPPNPTPSNFHDIPIHVIVFKEATDSQVPNIITRPERRLFLGSRNITRPIIDDASEAAEEYEIETLKRDHARLYSADKAAGRSMGYSLRRAPDVALPDMADFIHHPYIEDHGLPLEIHDLHTLIEQLETIPGREIDLAYLRAFGAIALQQPG